MSITIRLVCDVCGRPYMTHVHDELQAHELRRRANVKGWLYLPATPTADAGDICPGCAAMEPELLAAHLEPTESGRPDPGPICPECQQRPCIGHPRH